MEAATRYVRINALEAELTFQRDMSRIARLEKLDLSLLVRCSNYLFLFGFYYFFGVFLPYYTIFYKFPSIRKQIFT